MSIAEYYSITKQWVCVALSAAAVLFIPHTFAYAEPNAPALVPYDGPTGALTEAGWRQLRVKDRPVAEFRESNDGVVTVNTHQSAGFLYRAITESESGKSRLAWSWKVEKMPAPSDLSRVGEDDRPLAVHIWFPVNIEKATLWQAMKSGIGNLLDLPVPGKILTYVWGGTQAKGARIANPYLPEDGALIVLRSGQDVSAAWQDERVNFAADYKSAFGGDMPSASYLVISADTDDRAGISAAAVKDIRFDG
ncbi:MAG: hypothetical protein CMM59_11070 [Rhodospirillaceae bacterium]|nr:hypothetical protein [Rhodospirillaceae bacterium]